MVLADFETSKLMAASGPSPSTVTSVLHVSFGYTAPELLGLGGHSKYSEKSDMYAVGVVLAQLLIGRWGGDVAPPTAKTVAACGDDVVSPKVKKLLLQLLSENPDRRPSARALLLLPFFKSPFFAEIAFPFAVTYFSSSICCYVSLSGENNFVIAGFVWRGSSFQWGWSAEKSTIRVTSAPCVMRPSSTPRNPSRS